MSVQKIYKKTYGAQPENLPYCYLGEELNTIQHNQIEQDEAKAQVVANAMHHVLHQGLQYYMDQPVEFCPFALIFDSMAE